MQMGLKGSVHVRRKSEAQSGFSAAERGEIDSDALGCVTLLVLTPAILATIWSGLYPDTNR